MQTPARFVLLVLTFVAVTAAAAFVCVEPPASSACPIIIPKPLRVRYKESALVAVVRVGDTAPTATGEDGPTLAKTSLRISTLLKGETKERVVNFYHYIWNGMDETDPNAYAKNDVLLVFLNPHENGDGYTAIESEQAVKKLSPDDLKVYVSRIEELALIMRSEKPDMAALTEWIVRCIEEPATRWEGAYDLASGVAPLGDPSEEASGAEADAAEANTKQGAEIAQTDGEQAKPEGDAAVRPASPTVETTQEAGQNVVSESGARVAPSEVISRLLKPEERIDFVALLTPAHKERLMNALLAAEELEWGELMLLDLVSHWKDARLVPFSLKHLARMADKPLYHAEVLMRIVAYTHADQTLINFVADYSKAASYEDLNLGDEEDESQYELDDSEATAEERAEYKKEIEQMKAAAAEARFQRSGKLRHFLALADQPQQQP